jgi:hypothetical protein
MSEKIFHIFGISIWMGHLSFITRRILPRVSYFDGGSYWKLSFYWLKYIVEFSGGKRDRALYKEVTREELDEILRKV